MPKEVVRGGDADEPFQVEVAWGADGEYVQVLTSNRQGAGSGAVVRLVQSGLTALKREDEFTPQLAHLLTDALDAALAPEGFVGWYCTLTDRADVNALIRHLRRARDNAFGKDE